MDKAHELMGRFLRITNIENFDPPMVPEAAIFVGVRRERDGVGHCEERSLCAFRISRNSNEGVESALGGQRGRRVRVWSES